MTPSELVDLVELYLLNVSVNCDVVRKMNWKMSPIC